MKLSTAHSDVTSRELSAHRINAGVRRIVESNLIGFVVTDADGTIEFADETFLSAVGYSRDELPQRLCDLTPPEHHRLDDDAFEKLFAFGTCTPFEKEFTRSDGSRVPVLFGAALSGGEISCFVIDLSRNKQWQGSLNHLAYHDALTDLPNQSLFKDRLKQAIALSHRSNQMQAVMLLNLDRFKTVNDSLGYLAGDLLLQSVAQRLTSCVRDCDTVARFGGDEFAVLLTQISRAQDAATTANAIRQALNQAFLFSKSPLILNLEQLLNICILI